MAATKRNAMNHEEARQKIKTTQLINRLQNNALGEISPALDPGQVRSIEILLRKCVADLSAITLQGDPNNPLRMIQEVVQHSVRPKP